MCSKSEPDMAMKSLLCISDIKGSMDGTGNDVKSTIKTLNRTIAYKIPKPLVLGASKNLSNTLNSNSSFKSLPVQTGSSKPFRSPTSLKAKLFYACSSTNKLHVPNTSPNTSPSSTSALNSEALKQILLSNKPDKIIPLKDREYDASKHCGVIVTLTGKPCTRSLTCKCHALSLRRAVPGRRLPFDELLQEHRNARQSYMNAKRGIITSTAVMKGAISPNKTGHTTSRSGKIPQSSAVVEKLLEKSRKEKTQSSLGFGTSPLQPFDRSSVTNIQRPSTSFTEKVVSPLGKSDNTLLIDEGDKNTANSCTSYHLWPIANENRKLKLMLIKTNGATRLQTKTAGYESYTCGKCGKKFNLINNLHKHLLIHSGVAFFNNSKNSGCSNNNVDNNNNSSITNIKSVQTKEKYSLVKNGDVSDADMIFPKIAVKIEDQEQEPTENYVNEYGICIKDVRTIEKDDNLFKNLDMSEANMTFQKTDVKIEGQEAIENYDNGYGFCIEDVHTIEKNNNVVSNFDMSEVDMTTFPETGVKIEENSKHEPTENYDNEYGICIKDVHTIEKDNNLFKNGNMSEVDMSFQNCVVKTEPTDNYFYEYDVCKDVQTKEKDNNVVKSGDMSETDMAFQKTDVNKEGNIKHESTENYVNEYGICIKDVRTIVQDQSLFKNGDIMEMNETTSQKTITNKESDDSQQDLREKSLNNPYHFQPRTFYPNPDAQHEQDVIDKIEDFSKSDLQLESRSNSNQVVQNTSLSKIREKNPHTSAVFPKIVVDLESSRPRKRKAPKNVSNEGNFSVTDEEYTETIPTKKYLIENLKESPKSDRLEFSVCDKIMPEELDKLNADLTNVSHKRNTKCQQIKNSRRK